MRPFTCPRCGYGLPFGVTPAELKVLELMAQGLNNQGIARSLLLGVRTVEHHVRSIFSKMDLAPEPGVSRRTVAVLKYREWVESRPSPLDKF